MTTKPQPITIKMDEGEKGQHFRIGGVLSKEKGAFYPVAGMGGLNKYNSIEYTRLPDEEIQVDDLVELFPDEKKGVTEQPTFNIVSSIKDGIASFGRTDYRVAIKDLVKVKAHFEQEEPKPITITLKFKPNIVIP